MELETMRSFNKTSSNTFKYIDSDVKDHSIAHNQPNNNQFRKIRPTIYKTFLRAKNIENNSKVRYCVRAKKALI